MKTIFLECLILISVLATSAQAECTIAKDPMILIDCLRYLTSAAWGAARQDLKPVCKIADDIARCVEDEIGDCIAETLGRATLNEIGALAKNCCPNRDNPKCSIRDQRIQEQQCFAADSLVTLADGTKKSVAQLYPGDSLLAYDDTTKQVVTTSLLTMLDYQPHHFALFKQVTTVTGRHLSLTSSHLLPTDTHGYVMAKNIQNGMYIYVMNDDGVLITETVANVSDVVKQGYIAPLTGEGTLIVNNVAASCYATINSHSTAHAVLAPMRWWYGLFGVSKETNEAIGVHWFGKMLYEMTVFLFPSIIHV